MRATLANVYLLRPRKTLGEFERGRQRFHGLPTRWEL
jgi:hypothetical protein